jgi:hypothetical protein
VVIGRIIRSDEQEIEFKDMDNLTL